MENRAPSLKFSARSFQLQPSIMADTGRFQELSPTKIQEILDNAIPEKNEESHEVRNEHI